MVGDSGAGTDDPKSIRTDFVQGRPANLMVQSFMTMSNDLVRDVSVPWEDSWMFDVVGNVDTRQSSTNS